MWTPAKGKAGPGAHAGKTAPRAKASMSGYGLPSESPAVESQHAYLPLGTGPLMTGSAKKDAVRRCITTEGHWHVRVRRAR